MVLAAAVGLRSSVAAVARQGPARAPAARVCVVDGKEGAAELGRRVSVNGRPLAFCSERCFQRFAGSPEQYVADAGFCPVLETGQPLERRPAKPDASLRVVVNNDLYYFCCGSCSAFFRVSPVHYLIGAAKRLRDPVTGAWFDPDPNSPRVELDPESARVLEPGHPLRKPSRARPQIYCFASAATRDAFLKSPRRYAVLYAPWVPAAPAMVRPLPHRGRG